MGRRRWETGLRAAEGQPASVWCFRTTTSLFPMFPIHVGGCQSAKRQQFLDRTFEGIEGTNLNFNNDLLIAIMPMKQPEGAKRMISRRMILRGPARRNHMTPPVCSYGSAAAGYNKR